MESILVNEKSILRKSTRSKILFWGNHTFRQMYMYIKESARVTVMVFVWIFYAFSESVHKILLPEHNEDL